MTVSIKNRQDLIKFAERVNKGEKSLNAFLDADIDLNPGIDVVDTMGTGKYIRPFEPIASVNIFDKRRNSPRLAGYDGCFDGQGHVIKGLYIAPSEEELRDDSYTRKNYQGLFGVIGRGEVKNLIISKSYISGSFYVGSICGENIHGFIDNCYSTADLEGDNFVGGICGKYTPMLNHDGKIIKNIYNCGANSEVLVRGYMGGQVVGNQLENSKGIKDPGASFPLRDKAKAIHPKRGKSGEVIYERDSMDNKYPAFIINEAHPKSILAKLKRAFEVDGYDPKYTNSFGQTYLMLICENYCENPGYLMPLVKGALDMGLSMDSMYKDDKGWTVIDYLKDDQGNFFNKECADVAKLLLGKEIAEVEPEEEFDIPFDI